MKKILFFCFLNFSFSLFAQGIIIERSQGVSLSETKHKYLFNEVDYVLLLNNDDERVYMKNFVTNPDNETQDVQEEVTLNIFLEFDPVAYSTDHVMIVGEDGYFNYAFWEGENPISISIPEGTYDFINSSTRLDNYKNSVVIKEQVEVLEGTSLTINLTEAQNYITTKFLDENGDNLEPGLMVGEDTVGGNAEILGSHYFYFEPLGFAFLNISFWWFGQNSEDEDEYWNFYINDISDRYSLVSSLFAIGYDGNMHISRYNTINGIAGSQIIQNNPEDYVFHLERFQTTVLGENTETYWQAFITSNIRDGKGGNGGWQIVDTETDFIPEEGMRIYLNNSFDDTLYDLLVYPAFVESLYQGDVVLTIGNPVISEGNEEVFYGSGASSSSSYNWIYNFDSEIHILPFHPQFSFYKSVNPYITLGDNVPIFNVITANVLQGSNKISLLSPQSIGRYGEIIGSNDLATSVEIKYNGESVYNGNILGLMDFTMQWASGDHPDGIFDVTFTNSNSMVDGILGKNITQSVYDWTNEDWTPPSLRMLQFRDTSGKVTDHFQTTEEGTVRLAAGDFYFDLSSYSFLYNEGNTVEFYYSPYNQDNWTELELTKYDEYFQMPAFGDYYEASLASVVVPEDNTWFDVKIICTDAAGNSQTQVISPAFKVEQANMGITEVDKTALSVYPNPFTNEINIKLPENIKGNYDFKVSDITGKLIFIQKNRTESQFVWNGTSLPKGIYILSIENNGKIIAEKVIKK